MSLSGYAFIEGLQVNAHADTPILLGHHNHSCGLASWYIHLEDDPHRLSLEGEWAHSWL